MNSTIAWTVQWHEHYNRYEKYNCMYSTINMNSTITWAVQYHEQYNNMNSTIACTVQ
jgi:hypothetical protein